MYDRYCKLRDERNITDYQVSKETQIAKSTFSDWKSGRSKPGAQKLLKLARYFNVPIEYFLED